MPVVIKIHGFEELKKNTEHLANEVVKEAIARAQDVAAALVKAALQSAAPSGESGQLARSIVVYESLDRRALTKERPRRLLVGPEKRKGFYGFFQEYGTRKMPARPWARPAADSIEGEALEAGRAAFDDLLTRG